MIPVHQAQSLIEESLPRWDAQRVLLVQAQGRVLREAVVADRDQPPFDRVTMDGVALSSEALGQGRRQFSIQSTQAAGQPPETLIDGDHCIEIMTGAVLPSGCDTVIPVERIEVESGHCRLESGYQPEPGQFVHRRGSDYPDGHPLLASGTALGAPEIAVLAAVGRAEVVVSRWPRIAVMSTGDELVEPGESVALHQIRCSNDYGIVAALHQRGMDEVTRRMMPDDREALRGALETFLADREVLILSGGVSKGKFDYLPGLFEELGVSKIFHRVRQQPGKPLWFGKGPDGQLVFALPGNPVSALVCCHRYVLPALMRAAGQDAAPRTVALAAAPDSSALTRFLPVRLGPEATAEEVTLNTSGDFFGLSGTDGFIEWPSTEETADPDLRVPFYGWSAA